MFQFLSINIFPFNHFFFHQIRQVPLPIYFFLFLFQLAFFSLLHTVLSLLVFISFSFQYPFSFIFNCSTLNFKSVHSPASVAIFSYDIHLQSLIFLHFIHTTFLPAFVRRTFTFSSALSLFSFFGGLPRFSRHQQFFYPHFQYLLFITLFSLEDYSLFFLRDLKILIPFSFSRIFFFSSLFSHFRFPSHLLELYFYLQCRLFLNVHSIHCFIIVLLCQGVLS